MAPDTAAGDPTYGRIDMDIQRAVDEIGPKSLGQRVAMENTLQARRDARLTADADGPFRTPPLYSFSTGRAGWFSTVWQIRILRDDHVAMSGRTFGRRHEQRAWEQMQHVARRYGYAD